jgi:hypothetical protein
MKGKEERGGGWMNGRVRLFVAAQVEVWRIGSMDRRKTQRSAIRDMPHYYS